MSNEDAQREDPTFAAEGGSSTDSTQSLSQSTPPTQALPEWSPPYPDPSGTAAPPPTFTVPSFEVPAVQSPPAAYPYAGSEPAVPGAPPVPPTSGNPSHTPPAHTPPAYAPPTYGQPAYGPPPPSALPQYSVPGVGYAPPPQTNASALVLTIISGILTVSCYFTLMGIPSLVIGIIALTKQNTDIEGSRRLSRIGWITFGVVGVLYVLAIVGFITLAVMSDSSSSSNYEY